jgi:hypothetical protein
MKLRPLIHLPILAIGIVLAVALYTRDGEEHAPARAATPAPVAARAPDAAPRITQPPLVSVPALPERPHRARKRPSESPAAAPARRKPARKKATPQRSRLKPAPLEPTLVAPPE